MTRHGLALSTALLLSLAGSAGGATPPPDAAPLRFAVSFPSERSAAPLDGRVLLIVSKDGTEEPRFQIGDRPQDAADLRHRRRRPGARRRTPSSTRPSSAIRSRAWRAIPAGDVPRPGAAPPLRDVPPRRRPHRQAADGPRRGAAVEQRAGQPLLRRRGRSRSIPSPAEHDPRSSLDKVIPPIPDPPDDEVHQARADPERAAVEVLGPRHVPRRARPPARGLRRAPRRALSRSSSTTGTSRRRSTGFREEPPDPNLKPDYSERFHLDGLQPDPAGVGPPVLQGLDRPGFPRVIVVEIQHANPYYDDSYAVNSANLGPYGDAIDVRADPVPREEVPRARRGLGALHVRRLDGRLGGAGGPGLLSRTTTTALRRLPRPDRLPRLHRRRTSTRTRTPTTPTGPWKTDAAARAMRNYLGHISATLEDDEPARARARHEGPLGRAVGHLGGRLLAGRAPTATRSGSGTSAPASSTRRSPRTGRSTTT